MFCHRVFRLYTGGFACTIQPHREVKPESGLSIYEIYDMKACRITTLFSGRGGGRKEKDRDTIKGRAGRVCFCCPAACIATHCLHTAAQRMGGNPFLLSSRTHKTAAQGEGERLAFAVQPHVNAAQSRAQGEDRERKGEGGEEGKQEHLIKRKGERGGAGCC